ncbi:MAG: universal stress protein [Chitinophagales bacterium]
MQSILVPTDLSTNSVAALKYALYIAKELNYNIHVIHVIDVPDLERFVVEEEVKIMSHQKILKRLNEFVDEKVLTGATDFEEINITYHVERGNATSEILKINSSIQPVLIVMGACGNGASQWDSFWLGGTTKRVVKKAGTPVLVIPDKAVFNPIKKIVFASDFILEDLEIINTLLTIARQFQATIEVIHVKDTDGEVNEPVLKYLRSKFVPQIEDGILKFKLIDGDNVSERLNEYVANNDISMLAVLDERDSLITKLFNLSLSYKIANNASIPTLVFQEN